MAKPTQLTINKKQQKQVLAKFKVTKNARVIAEMLDLPRHHVMAFLETEGLRSYSEGSYR